MNAHVQTAVDKTRDVWSRLGKVQRIAIVGVTALLFAIFAAFMLWITRPDYRPLYTKLSPEDANRVVNMLQTEKVSYRLEDNGSTVLVPADSVYDMRIKIAGEGNLVGQGIGFEIFDAVQMGQTEFVQRINYQRALQGELARTISEFPNVDSARVHLVIPQRSLFIEEQQSPSASVVVRLVDPSAKMSPREIKGMVNLMTMAVEGLDEGHVSITDSNGKVLFAPEDETTGLNNAHLEYRLKLESSLEQRINELLSPVLGPGKMIAKVNATLDYSQRTIRREIYDPDTSVVRSEQRSEEQQTGRANLEGGSTDVNFRGDGLGGSLSSQEGNRESRTINYEINKEEHTIVGQMGEITRLTVAVAVDGTYTKTAEGSWEYTPRSEQELEQIRQLVANAVGFSAERGDTIEVSNMAFGESDIPVEPNAAELLAQFAERMGRPLLIAFISFLFLMLVVRPLVLALVRPKVEAGEVVEGLEGLPAAEEQYALYEAQEQEARAAEENAKALAESGEDGGYGLESGLSLDDIKARALQLAERNIEQTVFVIRSWMKEGVKN
ncbi:MAG TPA: flagellar M-ring protein FliF [Candidatus Mailhella merdavium]|nr:flagellar M-ring protein FliF [Candidatus Mailhella merdavium]